MANLFKSFKHEAHPSRSAFDLSRKAVFSTKPGQLTPCLCVETVPGDNFTIDMASLTRTQTFNTAAFLRGKQHFDFFFVPYSQLWHPFNQFITQRDDIHSATQLGHLYVPTVSLSTLVKQIWIASAADNDDFNRDVHGWLIAPNAFRLLDLLGYGDFSWMMTKDPEANIDAWNSRLAVYDDVYVNVFRLAAYQHIWYDFYRNKYYDVADTGGIPVENAGDPNVFFGRDSYLYGFNFDDIPCNSLAGSRIDVTTNSEIGQMRRYNLCQMRYAPWKKDLFTSAMPSQQFGAVSSVDISGVNILNNAVVNADVPALVGGTSTNNQRLFINVSSSSSPLSDRASWSIPSAFDVLSLRKAEALQQWKQNCLRAGNMTDDNFESHFGTKPYYDADENVNYLGSFDGVLDIAPVETTANSATSGNNTVGDLAGKGTLVAKGNKIKFQARDFGIIMCINYFTPENEYASNFLDKANQLYEQFDFFTPEFQNIGLEAITQHEQSLSSITSAKFNNILGYAPRYYMYKTAVDRCYGEFAKTYAPQDANDSTDVTQGGSLSAWVAPREDDFVSNYRLLGSLYVNPSIYDNVFGVAAGSDRTTDQFLNNVYFDVKAVRPMTVLGLPQF